MLVSVSHDFLPKHNSVRASQVMDHFGINFEQGRHVVADGLELPIEPGQVVLFTGASGSGKSSLMRAVRDALNRRSADDAKSPTSNAVQPAVISLDDLPLPSTLLIDSLDLPAADAMNLLSTCGLGEAHLMLRTPAELSDGQRYRFRLALALSQRPAWVLADEFTATLDRTLAKVVAYNIRRLADRTGTGFLLATTHEDVAADLAPDVHVRCRLDGEVVVAANATTLDDADAATMKRGQGEEETSGDEVTANHTPTSASPLPLFPSSPLPTPASSAAVTADPARKKKASPSPPTSGSPRRPVMTGRTSLGGITAAITSASPAS